MGGFDKVGVKSEDRPEVVSIFSMNVCVREGGCALVEEEQAFEVDLTCVWLSPHACSRRTNCSFGSALFKPPGWMFAILLSKWLGRRTQNAEPEGSGMAGSLYNTPPSSPEPPDRAKLSLTNSLSSNDFFDAKTVSIEEEASTHDSALLPTLNTSDATFSFDSNDLLASLVSDCSVTSEFLKQEDLSLSAIEMTPTLHLYVSAFIQDIIHPHYDLLEMVRDDQVVFDVLNSICERVEIEQVDKTDSSQEDEADKEPSQASSIKMEPGRSQESTGEVSSMESSDDEGNISESDSDSSETESSESESVISNRENANGVSKKGQKKRHSSGGAVDRSASPVRQLEHELNRIDQDGNYIPEDAYNSYQDDLSSLEDPPSPAGSESPLPYDDQALVDDPANGDAPEEQEDPRDYCPGGYYPVQMGEVFNGRYHVIRKVGWGHFSTVWLCWDTQSKRFVALKIVKSAENYAVSAADEITILSECMDKGPHPGKSRIIEFLDSFKVSGVNGEHTCMVFEVLGCTLLKLIIRTNYSGLMLNHVRIIIKQILEGLSYLHDECNIIHTDLKPENVLVEMTHSEIRKMASDTIMRLNCGLKPDITETCNMYKPDEKKMSKNKKKKLRKRKKKQREVLEKQLYEVEGLNISITDDQGDMEASQTEVLESSAIPDYLLNDSMPSIPRVTTLNLPNTDNCENSNDKSGKKKKKNKKNGKVKEEESETEELQKNGKYHHALSHLMGTSPFNSPRTEEPEEAIGEEPPLKVKIADLGNACWTTQHFTSEIQTRQYRALEVIIGAGYDTSADIWSVACIAFELATGDYLFEPHGGQTYGRDEDHLAHVIELLGMIPPSIFKKGKYWQQYFNKLGGLLHIPNLRPWSLHDVLVEKYQWPEHHARGFADFLVPMLEFDPEKRISATEALKHPWINTPISEDPSNSTYYVPQENFSPPMPRKYSI
ncbi:unnamed protein product [Bursaphelenchus xylophilus]|uniref:non-specific serine/threonine protein kinase n=1 Tax=Bursaphelenchus xylophilus TaxID=6326 RepID=A0A1I7SST0_BURXY|nr:unnamed protein product [Bursaphelenchus xylophilus]CAG9108892.1 unnamed protein product [Bursaphelenchus xylophilus]